MVRGPTESGSGGVGITNTQTRCGTPDRSLKGAPTHKHAPLCGPRDIRSAELSGLRGGAGQGWPVV